VVHGAPIVRSARDLFRAAVAVVTIVDPDEGRDMAELLLQSAFGLTRAEAQTAAFLAAGLDLAQIAIERRVGLETVKSHVKALAIKTATHSRSEQVMLFNRVLLGSFSRHR
jgi:DNA-binding CsgD family transcriptional regulator